MPRFHYKAVAPGGDVIEAEMDAPDRDSVIAKLQADNHLPIRAEEVAAPLLPAPAPAVGRAGGASRFADWFGDHLALRFTRSLGKLLGAGLPLDRALGIMAEVSDSRREAALARGVLDEVKGGLPLSAALGRQGKVFDRFALALVRAGEASGQLPGVLERLGEYQARARKIAETVRTALIYPAFLLAVAVLSIAILLTVVIPQFEQLFVESARELPLLTRLVFGVAGFVQNWGWLLLALLILALFFFRRRLQAASGRLRWDGFLLRLPLIGRLLVLIETERFARSLGALLGGGVALQDAVLLSGQAMRNRVIGRGLEDIARRVGEGAAFGASLQQADIAPPLAVQLVRVGEETGRLPEMLGDVADIYAGEAETAIKRAMALIEPLLILALGLVVAIIVLSVLVAIVGLNALAL